MIPRSAASRGFHNAISFVTAAAALALPLAGCTRPAPQSGTAEAATAPIIRASALAPVVLEEFQSQGCSSCPPANANVNALADRPEVLALSYAVTYWDQLGWKDTFDRSAFTQRQWDYAHHAGRGNVATPQVIVNGTSAIVGSDRAELLQILAREGSPAGGPAISAAGSAISIGGAKTAQPATVWLVRYDPREQWVSIRAGENEGRKLPHRNIVRELVELGEWTGTAAKFDLPATPDAALRSAILVQAGAGGPIIAARRI
ncbi:MAG: DUF1223 domain-containing protein [Sphingomicrobium sp.]